MQLIKANLQGSRRLSRNTLRYVASLGWMTMIGAFACISSQALAYEFTVTNTDSQAIEIATAYGTDLAGRPFVTVPQRFIDGPFVLKPGESKLLFTYWHTLEAVWLSVRIGDDARVWQPTDRETFDVTAESVQCTPYCGVPGFPGFSKPVQLTQSIYDELIKKQMPQHFAKVSSQVKKQNANFNWGPQEHPVPPMPVPPMPVPPMPVPPMPVPPKPSPNEGISICNQSGQVINAAFGYFDTASKAWVSAGWYVIDESSCSQPLGRINGAVYGYATNDTHSAGTFWLPSDQEASFCLDSLNTYLLPYAACIDGNHTNYRIQTFGLIKTNSQGRAIWMINP